MNILIKNGTIIDGTGRAGYSADVLIKDDRIERIAERIEAVDYQILDATNKVVAPGFIDMHSHGDLTILEVNKAEAYLLQGVTTLVVGVCGVGLAPANDLVREYYNILVTKLFSTSGLQLYDTIQELMEAISRKGVSVNLAFFIPHGNIRAYVLGMEDRPPNTEEIERMKAMVKENMEAGAFGLSTGLIYPPGEFTRTAELIEVSKALKEYDGIYVSHMRNEGKEILEQGIGELLTIARGAQVRTHISHLKVGGFSTGNLASKIIKVIKNAREQERLFLHADLYPYEEVPFFVTASVLKPWVFENLKENLTNPETRGQVLDDIFEYFFQFMKSLPKIARFLVWILPKSIVKRIVVSYLKNKVRILRVNVNHDVEGKFLGEGLRMLYPNRKFLDALLDFIRDEQAFITLSYKWMDERKSILSFFKQDFVCIGSDGFLVPEGNTHPRGYGTFPRVLGDYVREKQLVSLEEGIRKMTSLPASILRLTNRGLIKEGYKADLIVFDPKTIRDRATYEKAREYPEGIDYVIVNGDITVTHGQHLGVLNGRILKSKKAS